MIPFQFDLIQLLPKCQQVELLFLTFSSGNYATSNDPRPDVLRGILLKSQSILNSIEFYSVTFHIAYCIEQLIS